MEDWEAKPLGDLCEFQRGLTYGKSDEVDVSSNVVLRANNVNLATHTLDLSDLRYITDSVSVPSAKKVRRGSLLICTASGSKSHMGKIAYVDEDYGYAFGGFMGQITPSPRVDGRYLFYALTSPAYKAFIEALSDGININNLKFDDLRQFTVPVPPLPEQRRIVVILDEAFEAIATAKANTEKSLQNAREVFSSALAELFPSNTESVSLAELSVSISDGDHSPPPKAASGVPFITISNVDKETQEIDFTSTFTVPREYFDNLKSQRRPQPGDVLYTVTGSFGIPILVEGDREFCFQRHIGLIRPKSNVDSRWLMYGLLSPMSFAQADAGATGTAQRTVSLGVLRGLRLPRVSSEAQCLDADRLDALDTDVSRLKGIAKAKIAALEELKKSLLHQAFTGQL
jgi:type I restriction enzyme S subunit